MADNLGLNTLVILFILIGIFSVTLTLFGSINDKIYQPIKQNANVENETITISGAAPYKLSANLLDNSTVILTNNTGEQIPAGDFAIDADSGLIITLNNTDWGPNVNASYTHQLESQAFNLTRDVERGFSDVGGLGGSIGIVAIFVLIIGILIGMGRQMGYLGG